MSAIEQANEGNEAMLDLMQTMSVGDGEVACEGFVKIRLVHAQGFSLLVPDVLVLGRSHWFAPQYFTATLLGFLDDAAYAQFSFEPSGELRLIVAITRDRFVRAYDDGSFLYACRIAGPAGFEARATGGCRVAEDHTIWLDLFHHTTDEAGAAICASRHFRGSSWNIQGNKALVNVAYAYFTSLPTITTDAELQSIAMATDGEVSLIRTNGATPADVVNIKVYRENTFNRRHSIAVRVPAHAVAPQHIWRHDPYEQATYYEVSKPAIFRIGLEPSTVLPFDGQAIDISQASMKRFDYVILGYADTLDGLLAPYDEEETKQIFKVERCEDLFAFWRDHANSDQFSQKTLEMQKFGNKPVR
ncbi:MAG: hypothetical protein ACRCTG_06085 [Aestuariivirga sp.]